MLVVLGKQFEKVFFVSGYGTWILKASVLGAGFVLVTYLFYRNSEGVNYIRKKIKDERFKSSCYCSSNYRKSRRNNKRIKDIKMKKIKILIYKLWNKVYCWCHKKPKVVGTDDTLDKLIKDNCSISRFGDGEFSLILGGSIAFQRYDKVLEEKLREVLESESERHLVGIPNVFGNLAEFSEESRKWWENYLLGNRKKIYSILPKNKIFYDAQITRIYINRKDKSHSRDRFEKIKTLWNNKIF